MTVAQVEIAQQMAPEILLQKIEGRMARLEDIFSSMLAAVAKEGKADEQVLGVMVEAAARNQKARDALGEPEFVAKEGLAERGRAADGLVEEGVGEDVVLATSERLSGIGEASQSVAANASPTPSKDKDDDKEKGEEDKVLKI